MEQKRGVTAGLKEGIIVRLKMGQNEEGKV